MHLKIMTHTFPNFVEKKSLSWLILTAGFSFAGIFALTDFFYVPYFHIIYPRQMSQRYGLVHAACFIQKKNQMM